FAVAVHMLALMAGGGGEAIKTDQIGGGVHTKTVGVRRILCSLSRAGVVVPPTGAAGGSRRGREGGAGCVVGVYRAGGEGGVFALHRQSPSRRCLVGGGIESVLKDVLGEVNLAVERVLAKTTIEQVFQSVRERKRGAEQRLS